MKHFSRILVQSQELTAHALATLLVQGAHYILGPFGEDSDLRRWGRKLSERGGKKAKRRAVVGVARKLAVLLHRLWVSGEVYEPLRNSQKTVKCSGRVPRSGSLTSGDGPLWHPQKGGGSDLAEKAPSFRTSFRTHQFQMAELGGTLV